MADVVANFWSLIDVVNVAVTITASIAVYFTLKFVVNIKFNKIEYDIKNQTNTLSASISNIQNSIIQNNNSQQIIFQNLAAEMPKSSVLNNREIDEGISEEFKKRIAHLKENLEFPIEIEDAHSLTQTHLDRLAILRSEAINGLFANRPQTENEYEEWEQLTNKWLKYTDDYLEKYFPTADLCSFKEIGLLQRREFPDAIPGRYNSSHNFLRSLLAIKFDRILQIISDYRGKV